MKKSYLFVLALLAVPALADNHRGFYAGVGASAVDDKQDVVVFSNGMTLGDTTAIRTAEITGGYRYNDALGGEVRLGSGTRPGKGNVYTLTTTEGVPDTTDNLEREIESYQSIYYRPELENDDAKLYALLGYTQISTSKATAPLTKDPVSGKFTAGKATKGKSESYAGLSYGIGVGFVIDEHFNINFEYKNICDELYNKPNMASVNIDYRF